MQDANSPLRRVRAGDAEFATIDTPSGTPLVLVHGFPLDHSMWDAQIAAFSAQYRVIAPDLRGFGGSQVTAGTVSMEQMADDVAAVLDALHVNEPVVFCGLSMGGYVGFEFWRKHAARLRALILCDTRAAPDTSEAAAGRLKTAEQVLRDGTAGVAEGMLPKLFAPATLEKRPELTGPQRDVMLRSHPEGVAAALRGMAARRDFRAELPKITLPTLVIVGEHDAISTAEEMRGIAQAIPDSELVVVPDAGHMSPLESSQRVNETIGAFLKRVVR